MRRLTYPAGNNLASSSTNVWVRALRGPYLRRALMVALIVGSLLNLINQPDAIFGDAPIQWSKLVLTYCVPFFVATYGAAAALRD